MKNTKQKRLLLFVLITVCAVSAYAYEVVKTELRSAWVATVSNIDWPKQGASEASQKAELSRLLDSLAKNNHNAMNLQVRSMCDAMYRSSYEPWSSYLTGTRGKDPGWDPLQYAVEECHKRGMECHAWINPYRWSNGAKWNTMTDVDKELYESGHLLSYNGTTILDPAQQWTIDRIVNVCREIVTNYDVDGILYDDYFYPNGIPSNSNAGDYNEWKNSGTSLSIGDWRRANVNRMVKAVYDMIQEVKPWVRYGISPAGVACSSSTVAKKYGIDPCPGSDWQYNGIFSDPIAWYNEKSVDYIAPQVYWTIGYSAADFGKITPWWGKTAQKFGRHVYVSPSIDSFTGASHGELAPSLNGSGPNNTSYDEYLREVELIRSTNMQGAPGVVWWSCKSLYNLGAKESFAHYLKKTVFSNPALPPSMPWKNAPSQGLVSNIGKVAYTLSWDAVDNVRYTVYAVPEGVAQSDFNRDGKYLLGMTYDNSFVIPEPYRVGYQYAVCIFDRYGNEYSARFLGAKEQTLAAPQLIAPAEGEKVSDPFTFKWTTVEGATDYTLEIADDAEFKHVTHTLATHDTIAASTEFTGMKSDAVHYWRVHACATNYNDGVSAIRTFTPHRFEILNPANRQLDVPLNFTASWTSNGDADATVEIAKDNTFTASEMVYTTTVKALQAEIPLYVLHPGTQYYMRVSAGDKTTEPVEFTTVFMESGIPTFVTPSKNGETLTSNQHIELERQLGAENFIIEISNSATTWGRTRFVETLKDYRNQTTLSLGELKVNSALLVDGNTYYVRAKSSYIDTGGTLRATDFGDVVSFVYKKVARIGDVDGDGIVNVSDVTALINQILGTATYPTERCDIDGNGTINVSDVTALINIILG